VVLVINRGWLLTTALCRLCQWASENEHKPFRKHSQKSGRWQLHTLLSRVNSSGSRCVLRSPLREDLIDYRDVRREEYSRPPASALYCSDFCGLLSLVIGVADQNLNSSRKLFDIIVPSIVTRCYRCNSFHQSLFIFSSMPRLPGG